MVRPGVVEVPLALRTFLRPPVVARTVHLRKMREGFPSMPILTSLPPFDSNADSRARKTGLLKYHLLTSTIIVTRTK